MKRAVRPARLRRDLAILGNDSQNSGEMMKGP
jgi:hypothetical protein